MGIIMSLRKNTMLFIEQSSQFLLGQVPGFKRINFLAGFFKHSQNIFYNTLYSIIASGWAII